MICKDVNILITNQIAAIKTWGHPELEQTATDACVEMILRVFDNAMFEWSAMTAPYEVWHDRGYECYVRKMKYGGTRWFEVHNHHISEFIDDYSKCLTAHIHETYLHDALEGRTRKFCCHTPYSGFNYWSKESVERFYKDKDWSMPPDSIRGAMTRYTMIELKRPNSLNCTEEPTKM